MKALIVASFVMALAACGTDVDLGSRPAYLSGSNTLTLFVYDGQSGAAIADAMVTLRIGDSVLTASADNNTYTVAGIPAGTFPITVTRDGYLTFTSAAVTFAANGNVNNAATVPGTYVFSVGMFPQQSVATDLSVKVYDQGTGAPIGNGSVVAILDSSKTIAGNAGIGAAIGNSNVRPLPGSIGFLPTSVTANITNGTATLARDKLVYGATYDLFVVSATNAQGQIVTSAQNLTAVAGQTSSTELVLFVSGPDVAPVALSANNEDPHAITQTLDITFPYPVQTCSDATTWTWTNTSPGTSTARPPATGAKVIVTSPSTNVLRIAPVVDQATVTVGQGLALMFSGISVEIAGSTTCTSLAGVSLRDSSTHVNLTITQSLPSS